MPKQVCSCCYRSDVTLHNSGFRTNMLVEGDICKRCETFPPNLRLAISAIHANLNPVWRGDHKSDIVDAIFWDSIAKSS